MSDRRSSRRQFVSGLTVAGAAGLLGFPRKVAAAEPPPETTVLRIHSGGISGGGCIAPQYVAEELLRGEGFTDVQYVKLGRAGANQALAAADIDLTIGFIGNWIVGIDRGDPIVLLSGIHVGCYGLFGARTVRAIRDLKGKTVGVTELGSGRHTFLVSLLAYVGLDPRRDVTFATQPVEEAIRLLADGQLDAYQGFAEEVEELRARNIGHMLLNTASDRPWSQYFCCVLAGNREFVQKHPVATRRALRAMLKATNLCALEPDRVATFLGEKGYTKSRDYSLQMLKQLPYDRWRAHDPEDTIRFYALRLREGGLIRGTPQKIIAQGTDWRFLKELRKELKG